MGAIRAAKGVARSGEQFGIDGCQISFGQEHVAVEDEQIVALRTLGTVVASLSRPAVGFGEIADAESVGVASDNAFAGDAAAVFDNEHFKIGETLARQGVE